MTQKKPRKKDEEILQQTIMSYLSFHARKYNFIYFAPMNEMIMAILTRFRVPKEQCYRIMSFLRKMGWLPGVSDIVLGHAGKMYCMELKTEIGVQSKAQILFMNNVRRTDVEYEIVRSFEECENQMHLWGIIQ